MSVHIWRKRVLGTILLPLAATAALLLGGGASQADPGHPYLALGDSVSFGYITQAGFEYRNADNFVGFPSYVGLALGKTPTNAACPGETTAGFISATGADNGCRPYKANYPLHTAYTGTQLDFATAFLNAHPNTKLVTIQLGANDAFILEKQCGGNPSCIAAGIPTLLATVGGNMDTILKAIDATRFHGRLVIVNYYSLDYSDPSGTALTSLLNQAITSHAKADGAVVADAFTAFEQAAASAAGKTCEAGLLNTTPGNQTTCDVHPTQSGAELLAQSVVDAYQARGGD
jgi:lysophospholipase L1-like esterase